MIEIVPAVLPKSFDELADSLERLKGVARTVQVDLVGSNVLAGQEAMPLWEDFDFEVDMMLPNPVAELDSILALGPVRVVVHAQNNLAHEALTHLQSLRGGNYPVEAGVALLPTATPSALHEFDGLYDYVQVMGIERVGAQGQPFSPKTLDLVRALRTAHPELLIQIDGSVNKETAKQLVEAGATRLVAGSAILGADNPAAAYAELVDRANS